MYPQGTPPGDDPFGLFGAPGDPFAADPPQGGPPPGNPPEGQPPPSGEQQPGTTPGAPAFVALDDFNRVKSELEATRAQVAPLAWIGEALSDPATRARVQSALFAGPGAPPPAAPPADLIAAERERLMAPIRAKLAAGDLEGALADSAMMGATLAQATMRPQLETAAQPMMTLTAQNAIESFKNAKRAGPTGALFAKIESRFSAFVAATPPATLAQLAQSGQLHAALEAAYKTVLADSYEQGYTRALADGRIQPQVPQSPPPYFAGSSGAPPPPGSTPTTEDKDDAEFATWAREKGITFNGNTSEVR